jgi:hypothetical protein
MSARRALALNGVFNRTRNQSHRLSRIDGDERRHRRDFSELFRSWDVNKALTAGGGGGVSGGSNKPQCWSDFAKNFNKISGLGDSI